MRWAGFDFVVLDLEHSAIDFGGLTMLFAAARAAAIACVVRIEAGGWSAITRVLDMGPDGVMVPGVRSAEEAAAAVELARYQPAARRGLAPVVRPALQAIRRWERRGATR